MTQREEQILGWIREDPLISQQELALRAGITRSSVGVHIANLMRKGLIRGRGYLLAGEGYVVVVGAVNVDISGTPETLYEEFVAAGVTRTGAYCRNYSHSFIVLSYDEDGIVLLDGNSINGGDGFIQITEATWDYFYEYFLAGGDNPIDHIVQPTEECLLSLYLWPSPNGAAKQEKFPEDLK